MRLDQNSAIMVREPVAGTAYVSATRWNRVATVAASVLRRTPGAPHLPPGPLPFPCGRNVGRRGKRRSPNPSRAAPGAAPRQRGRAADGETERWHSNAVVARARYVRNKKSGFLIMLLDRRKCGATRSSRCGDGHDWRDNGSWSCRESRLPLILAAPCSPTQERKGVL